MRTQRCDSERLLERFPENHFDLVHARNTLDHSYQPVEAIRQMLGVVKPTGFVVLSHFANEAEKQEYQGFHQWNFCVENEDFIIWDKQSRVSVKDRLRGLAEIVEISPSGSDWVQAVLRKVGPPACDGLEVDHTCHDEVPGTPYRMELNRFTVGKKE